jgi:hypothetical protein
VMIFPHMHIHASDQCIDKRSLLFRMWTQTILWNRPWSHSYYSKDYVSHDQFWDENFNNGICTMKIFRTHSSDRVSIFVYHHHHHRLQGSCLTAYSDSEFNFSELMKEPW